MVNSMKNITAVEKDLCTGCGACLNACNNKAIEFVLDDEGFFEPMVESAHCTQCGICNNACPVMNPPEGSKVMESYAAQSTDMNILKDSTSGGIFTVLAQWIIGNNGIVYGCIWDKECNAIITKAEREEEIIPMRGSKYVWSSAVNVYGEIKQFLLEGRLVLFCGLPCQIAGLKTYLQNEYSNLFLVDFLCSGAPSPLAFKKYLDTICTEKDKSKLNFKFRNKIPYGVGVHITYQGQKKKNKRRGENISNSYYYSFYINLINRRSCYQCPFGTDLRISDLTICDYWGIENYHKEFKNILGVSALMINTEKGKYLINCNSAKVNLVKTDIKNIAKANNLNLDGLRRNLQVPANRDAF